MIIIVGFFFFLKRFSGAGFQTETGGVLLHAAGRPVHRQHAEEAPAIPPLFHIEDAGPQVILHHERHRHKKSNVFNSSITR